ncbi:hypothetical protein ANCCAN_27515 [Ancylostoma caninum]|uniref:Uncharacterized protein n=1 Tax=Ancylostoma caninum TaxID=29170 RepID=A0A368F565_ANCCA|nr:hypothetical protein ANCCAN_27515 [Ancylostoma caninum]
MALLSREGVMDLQAAHEYDEDFYNASAPPASKQVTHEYNDYSYNGSTDSYEVEPDEVEKKVYAKPHWSTANSMDVILESEREYNKENWETMYDDFDELFDAFAKRQGSHFNKRNLQRDEGFYQYDVPKAKYGVHGADCMEFIKFLLDLRPQKFHLRYAHVRCGRMTFSLCLAFSCPNYGFNNTTLLYYHKW